MTAARHPAPPLAAAFRHHAYPASSWWRCHWGAFGPATVTGCTMLGATVMSYDVLRDDGRTGRAWPSEVMPALAVPPKPALRLLQGGRA